MDLREKAKTIPHQPGVYLWKDEAGEILYVGMSTDLRARVAQYFLQQEDERRAELMRKARDVEFIGVTSAREALLLEQTLIKRHLPPYNVLLVDDKRYPYIAITQEQWPRAVYTRDLRLKGTFFGPFPDAGNALRLTRLLNSTFQLRQCRTLPKRECLYYHMHQCTAPCIGAVTPEAYAKQVEEAKGFLQGRGEGLRAKLKAEMEKASQAMHFEQAAAIRDLAQAVEAALDRQYVARHDGDDYDALGLAHRDTRWCIALVYVRDGHVVGQSSYFMNGPGATPAGGVLEAFLGQLYINVPQIPREVCLPAPLEQTEAVEALLGEIHEHKVSVRVPERGGRRRNVELAERNAVLLLDQEFLLREREGPQALRELQRALGLADAPERIECFDVSHHVGTHTVASLVVLKDGKPLKSHYRRFKIRTTAGGDDPGAMREVVERRYARVMAEEGADALPDLVVVDGGKPQVAAALEALRALGLEATPLIGLAKREEQIHRPDHLHPLVLDSASPALHLLQRARDEAHRFAIGYQGLLKRKDFLTSALDAIVGVGPERRRRLLTAFGSVEGLRKATPEEIAQVPGINGPLARRIHEALRTAEAEPMDADAPPS